MVLRLIEVARDSLEEGALVACTILHCTISPHESVENSTDQRLLEVAYTDSICPTSEMPKIGVEMLR
jgi:hypothetical protein